MKFCAPAFSQLRIVPSGGLKVCCKQRESIGNSNEQPLPEAINSPRARDLRLKLLRDEWPDDCGVCRYQEEAGAESWRIQRNRDFTDEEQQEMLARVDRETGAIEPRLSALEVAFSNLCNVACKMCQPNVSTTFGLVAQRSEKLKKMFPSGQLIHRSYARPEFLDELRSLLPGLKFLCVTGGEPLMSQEFHRFIDGIGEEKEHINFLTTSNLTQLRHGNLSIMERLGGFKSVQLCVSIEGPAPVHEYIRYPSKLDVILANAKRVRTETSFTVTCNITVGALNILRMPEAIEIVRAAFDPPHILFSYVEEPYLRVECLPEPLRELAASRLVAYQRERPYDATSIAGEVDDMITVTLERLKRSGNFDAFIDYLRAQDEATGQDMLECVPELEEFLPARAAPAEPAAPADAPAAARPAAATEAAAPAPPPVRPENASGASAVAAAKHARLAGGATPLESSESASLCVMPWIHAHVELTGDVKLCCVALDPGDESPPLSVREKSLPELFDSPYLRKVRQQMLAGEWPTACAACKQKQAMGVPSYRDTYNAKYPEYFHTLRTQPEALQPRVRSLDLRINNLCNFKCRMCTGTVSSRWQDEHPHIYPEMKAERGVQGIHDVERFWKEFQEIVPDLEEVHFAGGEPLLIEEQYKILEMLIAAGRTDVALRYDTNLSKLSLKHWDATKLWRKFPRVHVSLSLDGVGPVGEYIRYGMDFETWRANVEQLKRATPHVERGLHFVINAYNVLDFQKHYDTIVACEFVPQDHIGFTFLEWPAYLSVQVLHPMLKEQARRKLLAMAETDPLVDETCRRYVHGIIEHMMKQDLYPTLGKTFAEKTRAMDQLRKENLLAVAPELALMLKAHPPAA